MKISGFGNIPEVIKAYNLQKRQQEAGKKAPLAVKGEDTLVLSDHAREIQEFQTSLRELKDVREDRVNQLKKEIESGNYRVDPMKVAEAMIEDRILDKQA